MILLLPAVAATTSTEAATTSTELSKRVASLERRLADLERVSPFELRVVHYNVSEASQSTKRAPLATASVGKPGPARCVLG